MTRDLDSETAIAEVESCDFQCVAGPLRNSIAWQWLRERLRALEKEQPK